MNFKIIFYVIIFFSILILFNFSSGYINSLILNKSKRNRKLKEYLKKGYNFDYRWDCNQMTIAIDSNKKSIVCVVLGLTTRCFEADINNIVTKNIQILGVVPKLVTSIFVNLELKDGSFFLLRTLYIRKGFGIFKNGKIVKKALNQANEIFEIISTLK